MSEFKKYSNMTDIRRLNEGRIIKGAWKGLKNKVGRGARSAYDKTYRTTKAVTRFPYLSFTKQSNPPERSEVKEFTKQKNKAMEDYIKGTLPKKDYKKELRSVYQGMTDAGNRHIAPVRTLGIAGATGITGGGIHGLSKFGDDDVSIKQIKSGIENKGEIKDQDNINDKISRAWAGLKGVGKAAAATVLVPAKLTSDMIGYVAALTQVKTPGEMDNLFSKLYESDRSLQKQVMSNPRIKTSTKLRWKKYYATRKASDAVQSVKNAPKPVKIAAGAGALGAGAIGAGMLKREIDINRARVYGCDTIENPKQRLRCEYMVAKEDLKESKKFLSKCYDSNNPESCVKIYSQKIREAETKMLEAKKQLNRM